MKFRKISKQIKIKIKGRGGFADLITAAQIADLGFQIQDDSIVGTV